MPKISTPKETYKVCCYLDDNGVLHPNPLTIARTDKECADLTKKVLGYNRYQRARRGFRIMPFRLAFEASWIEVEEAALAF